MATNFDNCDDNHKINDENNRNNNRTQQDNQIDNTDGSQQADLQAGIASSSSSSSSSPPPSPSATTAPSTDSTTTPTAATTTSALNTAQEATELVDGEAQIGRSHFLVASSSTSLLSSEVAPTVLAPGEEARQPIQQQQPLNSEQTDKQEKFVEKTKDIDGQHEKLNSEDLCKILSERNQQIEALKSELEKYKLALEQTRADLKLLHQAQLQTKQKLISERPKVSDNLGNSSNSDTTKRKNSDSDDINKSLTVSKSEINFNTDSETNAIVSGETSKSTSGGVTGTKSDLVICNLIDGDISRNLTGIMSFSKGNNRATTEGEGDDKQQAHSTHTTPTLAANTRPPRVTPLSSSRVIFRTGSDGDGDDVDDDNNIKNNNNNSVRNSDHLLNINVTETTGDIDNLASDNIDDIIQDVGEIDLNLELQDSNIHQRSSTSTTSNKGTSKNENRNNVIDDDNGEADDEEEEDIISDGLLTSLTDAAINNLSQLAALQERCESQHTHQQQHQHQQQYQQQQQPVPIAAGCNSPIASTGTGGAIVQRATTTNQGVNEPEDGCNNTFNARHQRDLFATGTANLVNQTASALTGAQTRISSGVPLVMRSSNGHHHHHHQHPSRSTLSTSSSISPDTTIQADLSSSGQSLASAVAAAAVAAAAAAADDHHHNHPHPHHQQHLHQQQQQAHHLNQHPQSTRLISSALPSSEFYQSLHQHHAQSSSNLHYHHHQQQHSPAPSSALSSHYSQSTSVTPSPSSLMTHSRRSVTSTASSSVISPTTSPSYMRRHFLPERMPVMSPSPTSGIASGSSSSMSGTSSSLAHILAQQQRSVSALAGPISSPVSSSLVSGESSAVSPVISNKNSSQARLNNMQIRHKFGFLGSSRSQFNSPHGFCLGLNQEIVVADTNNHRVCIFDKSGSFISQFGSAGKEEGQLWNPRKVAILHRPSSHDHPTSSTSAGLSTVSGNRGQHHQISKAYSSHFNPLSSGHHNQQLISGNCEPLYVVCDRGAERSRMQLFTKDGAFIKKIGIQYIDIVAGLAITQHGLIIVVDSVSPTVYVISGETGILSSWFDCSNYMKEPSDIAVKSDAPVNEYFICDFKGHCVVVFSEHGEYLRRIGQDGLTSYPNGIDISDDGDILVGDSHGNRFHVVVFDRNGNFVSQFECPHVKVSRCCGLKITREGYIVTLAKNNHHVLVLDTIHI